MQEFLSGVAASFHGYHPNSIQPDPCAPQLSKHRFTSCLPPMVQHHQIRSKKRITLPFPTSITEAEKLVAEQSVVTLLQHTIETLLRTREVEQSEAYTQHTLLDAREKLSVKLD